MVKDSFELYFVPQKNIIYERARFNQRVQQANETVDSFITALAENCSYGTLYDELIRDQLVVGLRDPSLSKRMKLDKDLNLQKAVNMARQSENIKRQQTDLRGELKKDIDAVTIKNKVQKHGTYKTSRQMKHTAKSKTSPDRQTCNRCGKSPIHNKTQSPAKEVTCHTCKKIGHYSKMCISSQSVTK